ncbi:MAG: protein phosphatase 2C domain-containing protein [Nitrososphaerota archaeon]
MECIQCGAPLRPQARFCNVCGTKQPSVESENSQPSGPAVSAEQPSTSIEADAEDHGDGTGKQKRPPRIPRHRDEEPSGAAPVDEETRSMPATDAEAGAIATAIAEPEGEPESPSEPESESESEPEPDSGPDSEPELEAPDVSPPGKSSWDQLQSQEDGDTLPETPTALSISEMPTMEQPVLAPITAMPSAAPLDEPLPPYELDEEPGPPSQPAMPVPTDGFPWPLPPNIIVGGRYRVEELVRSSQTEHGPENVYRAHDIQAYEQCWSCGARHDIATALDPYCDQCGADMLGREFIMVEWLTSEVGDMSAGDGATAGPPEGEAEDGARETEGETRVFTQGQRTYQVAPKALGAIHFPTGVRISGYVTADDGRTRHGDANEDSAAMLVFDAVYNSRHVPHALGVVADGLGGHDSGQEASALVVRTMLEVLTPALIPNNSVSPLRERDEEPDDAQDQDQDQDQDHDAPGFDGETLLRDAARAANVALCAANDTQQADMGSTLVAALIAGDTAWIANMGDSRGYVYDDHGLRRVTKDHSLVEQLIDAGMITPEERYEHPQRNQILKSLGADTRLEADIFPQELRPGMRILLCSDGVWEMVRDDELARILRETASTAEACERIVRAANDNGGEDNISVVLLDAGA